jgi:hypothetical protein
MNKKSPAKVIAMPLSPGKLMERIRKLNNERKVLFSKHAFERKGERSDIVEITEVDVYKVLECGSIEGVPIKGKYENEWKATITFRAKGSRTIGVATVTIDNFEKILVTTVMWRDA